MAVSCDMKKKLEKVLKMEIGSKIYSMWTSPCSKLICSVVMWKFKASTQTIAKKFRFFIALFEILTDKFCFAYMAVAIFVYSAYFVFLSF